MDDELFSKVANIIAGQLDVSVEEVEPNATFIETLGADSLDVVELIMMIEETFDVEITDDAQEKIKTVQDLVNHLRELGK